MINKIRFPEWTTLTKSNKDEFYYPTTARKARTIDEAKSIYNAFLSQAYTHQDSVNFYGWLNQMAVEGLVLEAYEASYDIANMLEALPADKIVSTKVSHNKMRTHTAEDYRLDLNMKCVKAIAFYHMDEKDTAIKLSKELMQSAISLEENIETKFLHSIAYNFADYGDHESATKMYEYFTDIEGKKGKMKLASSTMEASSYFYKQKEYDKIIKITDKYLNLGENPEEAATHLYERLGATPYFVDHWHATYQGLKRYKDFALKAIQGEFIDMDNLKDGEFTGSHQSFKGSDFISTVTIKDGKINSVLSKELRKDNSGFDDRPFAVADILPQKIATANSFYVDSIPSATISSNSIKLGVMEALLKASK